MNKPCLRCGDLTAGTYCDDCQPSRAGTPPKQTARARGYDSRHDRLSRQLRRQACCSVCGTRTDLQLDHLPGSWERLAAGKPLRPGIDVDIKCGRHNREAGARRTLGGDPQPTRGGTSGGQAGKRLNTTPGSSSGGRS